MIRDKKLIEHYTEKYGVLPIVFSWDGMVFSSEHFNKKEINGRITYDFSLSIPNKPKIFIKSVIEYQFLFPPKKRIDGLPCYTYSDEERVIERSDCNDCILILYRMDGFYKDVLIFYNFEKKFLLKSVSLLVRPYWFDCNNFVYYDKKHRPCFVYDGELYNEENLKCTLYDWCIKYKSEKILNMFSAKNSLAAKDILWKSKEEYKWECNAGHIFLEQPKNLLLANGHFEDLCPFCKEIKDKKNAIISEENKKQHLKFIHEIYEKYGVNSPNEAYLIVRQKLLDAIEYAKNNPPWREPSIDWPKTAKGIFKYPNGKQGDINMFIATEYGVAKKLDGLLWEIEISTKHLDMIECLCEYGIHGSEFIIMANTRFAVAPLLSELMALYHEAEYEVRKDHWTVNRKGTDLIREYRESIRPKRNKIYEEVIKQGKSGGKWKSEQQAYALVTSIYPDAIYQHHEEWLDLQSLDIFIPSQSIAIEYQGVQHFRAVDIFGGDEGLKDRMKRDETKRRLCELHGITLIEWNYNDPLTKEFILEKITQVLNGRKG
ncbi:MAG: hypothetical protein IJX99_03235 [Clostridia bacterium]|nr:hypothetical protein [Clostridia bacterium]